MENTRASIWRSGNKKNLVIIPGISTLLYPTMWRLLSPSYFSYYAKYFTVNVVTFNHLPQKGTLQLIVEEYHKRLLQLQPYAVLAIEEGAFIAQHIATRQQLKKLVLVATSTQSNAKSQEVFEHWTRYVQQDRWSSLHKSMSHYFTNKHSFMKYLFFKKPQNPHQLTLLVEALKQHNSENLLAKINSETLIVGGDRDALISVDQYQKMLSSIPKSQLICVRGGCHHVYHQKKSLLEPNILHFLLRQPITNLSCFRRYQLQRTLYFFLVKNNVKSPTSTLQKIAIFLYNYSIGVSPLVTIQKEGPSMEQTTLQQMEARFSELEELIQKPEIMKNGSLYSKYLKEHGALSKIVNKYRELQTIKKERDEAKEILAEEKDSDMRAMATEELEELEQRESSIGQEIENLLITDEQEDNRNVIVEIRAGTGGDEACLFAQELFTLYAKYAERQYLRLEVLENTSTELGGIKEVSFSLKGKEAYKKMKFEGGGHRVQRIPSTESGGRIHTSACTIAVLPEVDDVEVEIKDTDLKIDYMRASGPGGQNVNKTSSAVRITHLPTGIVVSCQETPEQHKNRMKAMKVLRARLYNRMVEEQQKEINDLRKDQSGSGDRNERIRTYNFPQNRVTDHRINHSIYNLESIMQGNIDEFVEMLQVQEREEKLKKLGSIIQ